MARKNVKVVIPKNADELIELGESIIAKHTADGATSPLSGLDMTAFATRVADAETQNALQKQLRRDAELATESRDGLLGKRKDQNVNSDGTVVNMASRVRDILLGIYKGNEQQLGLWGFEVNQNTGTGGTTGGGGTTDPGGGTSKASIGGKVTNMNTLMPVAGALIELVGTTYSATTNATGDFALGNLPAGTYTVRITAPGYQMQEGPVTLTAGSNLSFNVQLIPSA